MAWMRMIGAESVAYHQATVLENPPPGVARDPSIGAASSLSRRVLPTAQISCSGAGLSRREVGVLRSFRGLPSTESFAKPPRSCRYAETEKKGEVVSHCGRVVRSDP